MKKVIFKVSGNKAADYLKEGRVFLTSESRCRSGRLIAFRNDVATYIELPNDFYKKHFKYCRSTQIYRTDCTWGDLRQFMTVEEFTGYGHVQIYPN